MLHRRALGLCGNCSEPAIVANHAGAADLPHVAIPRSLNATHIRATLPTVRNRPPVAGVHGCGLWRPRPNCIISAQNRVIQGRIRARQPFRTGRTGKTPSYEMAQMTQNDTEFAKTPRPTRRLARGKAAISCSRGVPGNPLETVTRPRRSSHAGRLLVVLGPFFPST